MSKKLVYMIFECLPPFVLYRVVHMVADNVCYQIKFCRSMSFLY